MSPSSHIATDRPRVGSYELVRLLGEGAMGRVWEARHRKLDRQVAIKMLRTEQANDATLVQRFFQEARTVNRISHPHIVEIHDFIEDVDDEGRPRAYFVMECLAGKTLADILTEGPLPLSRIVRITQQLTRALAAAHDVGVIHRDLKPENVFICRGPDGRDFVKVLDFGVAKLMRPDPEVRVGQTMEGAIIGTPRYMSPEQAASLEVDLRTDVYGVGCILYELLTGRPPFQGDAFAPLVARILTQLPEALGPESAGGEALPPSLSALVFQCLEKDPLQRPSSMNEVARRLALAERELHDVAARTSRQRVGTAVIAVLAVGLVAVAFGLRSELAAAAPPLNEAHAASVAEVTAPTSTPPLADDRESAKASEPNTADDRVTPRDAAPSGQTEPASSRTVADERTPEVTDAAPQAGPARDPAARPRKTPRSSRDAVLDPFKR